MTSRWTARRGAGIILLGSLAIGADPKVGEVVPRHGDEIVVCGRLVHTSARVVLWMDPGGYDAYRVERHFGPLEKASWPAWKDEAGRQPNRFGMRRVPLAPDQIERVRGGGWTLPELRDVVDQFVIHYDECGSSRRCFEILHDKRGLSVHFLLDLDGTIYQTLDVKEGAWHATTSNGRSIGIEIANIGAYPVDGPDPFFRYYRRDPGGGTRILTPEGQEQGQALGPGWIARPSRSEPIVGSIQGRKLRQYDLTPEQYDALIRLTATLCQLFPKIACDYPRDEAGKLIRNKLRDAELKRCRGILGHYHVQADKIDPGPAFQWDRVVDGARPLIVVPEP